MKKIFKVFVLIMMLACITACKTTDRLDSNESEISSLKEQLAQLTADYNAKLEAMEKDYNAKLVANENDYNAKVEALESKDTSQDEEIKETNSAIDNLKSSYDAKLLVMENDANTKKLVLENQITQNTNLINQYKSELDDKIATAKSVSLSVISGLKTDYDSRIIDINREITTNTLAINTLDTKFAQDLEDINSSIELSQAEIEAQIAELEEKHDADVAELEQKNNTLNIQLTSLATKLDSDIAAVNANVESVIATLQTEFNAKITLLQTQITNNQNAINELNAKLVADIAAAKQELNAALLALKEEIKGDTDRLEELIETNQQDIATINELIENCPPGASAYEIFKKYYPSYVGSEQDWLNDLINCRLKTDEEEEELVWYSFTNITIYADGSFVTFSSGGKYYNNSKDKDWSGYSRQYSVNDAGVLFIRYFVGEPAGSPQYVISSGASWVVTY